jgi:hypothetical protein
MQHHRKLHERVETQQNSTIRSTVWIGQSIAKSTYVCIHNKHIMAHALYSHSLAMIRR